MGVQRLVICLLLSGIVGVIPTTALEAGWRENGSTITDQLPEKVEHGSIPLPNEGSTRCKHRNVVLAKLSAAAAARIVRADVGGAVVEVELTSESGYLVWDVETLMQDGRKHNILVDAGNGRIMAARVSEEGSEDCDNCEFRCDVSLPGTEHNSGKRWWHFWKNDR